MLFGTPRRRPDLNRIRAIKNALSKALDLADDVTITVTELACLEEGCPPLETVVGLLRPSEPQLQFKLHKPIDAVDAQDLKQVCTAWGFDVETLVLTAPPPKDN
ncbi:MAG: hypothetical protein AAFU79_14375 [Myxococcota bacterium]